MAKVTGWSPQQLAELREAEFAQYLDLALRIHGVDPDKVHHGAPPPTDDDDPGIDPATLLHLPESVLMLYPPHIFAKLTAAQRLALPAAVRQKLEQG